VSGPPEDEERTEDEHDRCHRARHPLAHRENVVRAAPRAATPRSAEGERDLKPRDENESGRSRSRSEAGDERSRCGCLRCSLLAL
jgi:hypothetical protein